MSTPKNAGDQKQTPSGSVTPPSCRTILLTNLFKFKLVCYCNPPPLGRCVEHGKRCPIWGFGLTREMTRSDCENDLVICGTCLVGKFCSRSSAPKVPVAELLMTSSSEVVVTRSVEVFAGCVTIASV